jgi:hypothetical protein
MERLSRAISLTLVVGLLAYKVYSSKQKSRLVLPPGPKGYPLIGQLLSIPQSFEHLAFIKLGEQLASKRSPSKRRVYQD